MKQTYLSNPEDKAHFNPDYVDSQGMYNPNFRQRVKEFGLFTVIRRWITIHVLDEIKWWLAKQCNRLRIPAAIYPYSEWHDKADEQHIIISTFGDSVYINVNGYDWIFDRFSGKWIGNGWRKREGIDYRIG